MLCVSVLKCNMVSKNCHNYGEMPSICTYTRRTERKSQETLEEVHGVLSWDKVTRTHKAKQIESKQSKRLHCTSNIYYTCLYIGFFLIYWDKLRTM